MFALINSLAKLFHGSEQYVGYSAKWMRDRISDIFGAFLRFPTWVWTGVSYVFALAVAIATTTKAFFTFITGLLDQFSTLLTGANFGSWAFTAGSASGVFASINTFFPLEEFFSMLTAYFSLMLILYKARAIKAFIPGL